MILNFNNKKISGILTVLPSREILFEEEMHQYNFSVSQSLKLKTIMGFHKRRIAPEGICASDLCIYGLEYLFDSGKLQRSEIDALILVTQTPDHIMPSTSNIIQGKLGLKQDIICLDINQGCAGFVLGIVQAFMLLDQKAIKKVVLLNADVLSAKVSAKDRNSHPLIGDAASITILTRSEECQEILCSVKMDGTGAYALQIPAGGARMPTTPDTSLLEEDSAGNLRSKNHLVMKGDDVFNFVQKEVPPLINGILELAGKTKEEVDFYMFHQPNRFMLQKLADKIGVPREKVPSNVVEHYGNSSGCTIPVAITHNVSELLTSSSKLLCLAGFGVGLTWAAMLLQVGPLEFCEMIEM